MNCEEFRAGLLADEFGSEVSPHLAACPSCRRNFPDLVRLKVILANPLVWEVPTPELADRVVSLISGQARPVRQRRTWLVRAVAAVCAAAAVVALLIGFGTIADKPDWSVDLIATHDAPLAMAVIDGWNTSAGTRMELRVQGLSPSGASGFYEVWLTAPDGRHVSAGSFRGDGVVDLWVGVERRDYPRIWITLEPTDEDLRPSQTVVFDVVGESYH